MITCNSYDIDGVIYLGEDHEGLSPGPNDLIITGRSYTQKEETLNMLRSRGIYNFVFFNPLPRTSSWYGRETSGQHKAKIILQLQKEMGVSVMIHFEDDPIQASKVKEAFRQLGNTKSRVVMIGNGELID